MKKRVNELINVGVDIEPYDLVAIYSGVGSGKNSLVEGYHGEDADYDGLAESNRVLFITSRRAKVDQTINNDKEENSGHRKFIQYINSDADLDLVLNEEKSIICSNAHVIKKIKNGFVLGDESTYFWKHFDYVVIDEVHSLVADSSFAIDNCYIVFWLRFMLSLEKKPKVILMTGTPEPIKNLFKEFDGIAINKNILDLRRRAIFVKPKKFILTKSESVFPKIINSFNNSETLIYFTNHTKAVRDTLARIRDYCEKTKIDEESVFKSVGVFITDEKTNSHILEKFSTVAANSTNVKESIAKEERLSEDIRILITNSKAKEGINIKGKVDKLFVESHNLYDIIQMCGRVRESDYVKETHLIYDAEGFYSPEEYERAGEYEFGYHLETANSFLDKVKVKGDEEVKKLVKYIEKSNAFIRFNPFTEIFEANKSYNYSIKNIEEGNWKYKLYVDMYFGAINPGFIEFENYFSSDGSKIYPFKSIAQMPAREFLERCVAVQTGITELNGSTLSNAQKEVLYDFIKDKLQLYYNMNMVSFASLVKKCGYTVIPSNKKNNHTTNWTFEKIEQLDIPSKIDVKDD